MRNVKKLETASVVLLLGGGMMLTMPQVAQGANKVPHADIIQQQHMITGMVVDQDGEPIIGASVFEDGTKNGTVTNVPNDGSAFSSPSSE